MVTSPPDGGGGGGNSTEPLAFVDTALMLPAGALALVANIAGPAVLVLVLVLAMGRCSGLLPPAV